MCERVCEEQCNTATHQTAPCLHQLGGVRGVCERVCEEQCNTATHQTAPCLHQLGGVRGVCERGVRSNVIQQPIKLLPAFIN